MREKISINKVEREREREKIRSGKELMWKKDFMRRKIGNERKGKKKVGQEQGKKRKSGRMMSKEREVKIWEVKYKNGKVKVKRKTKDRDRGEKRREWEILAFIVDFGLCCYQIYLFFFFLFRRLFCFVSLFAILRAPQRKLSVLGEIDLLFCSLCS